MQSISHGDILEIRGHRVRVRIDYDYHNTGWPWDECDGMIQPEEKRYTWDRDDKMPSERILLKREGQYWVYDHSVAMKQARAEGWGLDPEKLTALTVRLGRVPTKGQIAEASLSEHVKYVRDWLDGDYYRVFFCLTLLDSDGEETDASDSCGGFELHQYDDSKNEYFYDEIRAAAEGLVADVEQQEAEQQAADMKEAAERRYWHERDVMTA